VYCWGWVFFGLEGLWGLGLGVWRLVGDRRDRGIYFVEGVWGVLRMMKFWGDGGLWVIMGAIGDFGP
jgi:hypothetical protein